MLPCPICPLAQHVGFGQNSFDVSIGLDVSVCIDTSCRWSPIFSSPLPPFHQLVGSYHSVGLLVVLVCVFFILMLPALLFPDMSHILPLVLLIGLLAVGLAVSLLIWQGMREKQRLRALQLADVDTMSGRDFELYVAEVLQSQGYQIRLLTLTHKSWRRELPRKMYAN